MSYCVAVSEAWDSKKTQIEKKDTFEYERNLIKQILLNPGVFSKTVRRLVSWQLR